MNGSRIFITGVGPVGPLGVGRDALEAALAKGLAPAALGEIRIEDYVASAKTYLDPNSLLALASVSLALRDAGVKPEGAAAESFGMCFGTRFGNVATVEAYLKMLREQGAKLASPLLFIHAYPNTSLSLAAIEFAIKGSSFNFNGGRGCGVQAVAQAFDELRAGRMSVMLAAAADTYTETTRRCAAGHPFNAATTLVLEREGDVLSRGARALAEVAGCGLARSGTDALSRALAQGSLGRPQLDWLLVDAPGEKGENRDCPDSGTVPAFTFFPGIHATDFVRTVGDSGAAGALTAASLAALVLRGGRTPSGLGLVEPPGVAAIVSADETGAAAVILRRIAN